MAHTLVPAPLVPQSLRPCFRVPQLIHVFDRRFVYQGLGVSADLEATTVVPLDATFDLLAIFQHQHHLRLHLDLLLQIEKLGLPMALVVNGMRGKPVAKHGGMLLLGAGRRVYIAKARWPGALLARARQTCSIAHGSQTSWEIKS